MSNFKYTLGDIKDALRELYPDDTDEWLRSGMAIKKEFGEDGFDVWDSWSSNYSDYKEKECRTRWKSFKGGSSRGSVSIAYIITLATQRGWSLDRPEFTPEEKEKFMREQEARQAAMAERWAKEEADIQRWYDVVAEASQKLLPMLRTVGNSKYLGIKKIHSCGCLFSPCAILLDFKADFTIDILTGDAIKPVFERVKKNKANGKEDADAIIYFKRGSIMVPMFNEFNQLRNFQIIYNDGKSKRFLTNGQKSGLWFVISSGKASPDSPLSFCEGFATGASIHMATAWDTVVTFDAGNMPVVAEKFRLDPRRKIFAGDNDWETALDPKKKNIGLVKCKEAARIGGGAWSIPSFGGNAEGLSDFNDLHAVEGLAIVRGQLEAALTWPDTSELEQRVENYSLDAPPDYGDIPLPDDSDYPGDNASPDPSLSVEQLTIENLLTRYALIDPDGKVWDSFNKKIIKSGAFKNIVRPKMFREWLEHEKRRTVLLDDVEGEAAAAQKRGRGGLAEALNRYVYLNPSDSVWDKQTRELVAVSHLKIAIADCFGMWVAHPDREEIPLRNLVFDPTQRCNTQTHINQFRGLALQPDDKVDKCRNILQMLMGLCNNDMVVYKWLRRWLAYPLINVGAKMETSVLCHSDVHGSGKSYFFDVVMRSIYGEYSRTVGQAQLEGQYNDWMSKVLYCVYEEVLSRSQRYSHTGTIKQTITGKTVRIEKKFMSGWEESNHMNSVFLSNEVLPLPVEPSDRRFLVIWPETKLYEHLQRGVDQDLKNGGAAAFYQFLLNTKMQDDDEEFPFDEHTKPPMTEAKERLIEHGRPIWEVFYQEWERGALMHNKKIVPYGTVRVSDLFKYFEAWCSQNKEHGMGSHRFSSFIGSKVKKRRDLDYDWMSVKGKATFFIIGKCPEDKTQQQWLGACVQGHDEILNAGDFVDSNTKTAA
ncbi:PriCT-2 domain-containing protein [Cellvibrio mixtus]|uniref:PriCT-2 domain-containing protein n=1 Tax=Cellvibrio mixtus TaxID=39650 RepID=UPI0006939FCD|nr:PriCT-2 domain-containing protein [Cellvibrio mixtus]